MQTLRYLEGRINAMMDIWGGDERPDAPPEPLPLAKPTTPADLSQTDVDTVIVDDDELFSNPGSTDGSVQLATPVPLIEAVDDLAFIESKPAEPPPRVEAPGAKLVLIEATAVKTPPSSDASLDTLAEIEMLDPGERLRRVVEAAAMPEPPPSPEASLDAFAEIEKLDTREKLRRFT